MFKNFIFHFLRYLRSARLTIIILHKNAVFNNDLLKLEYQNSSACVKISKKYKIPGIQKI